MKITLSVLWKFHFEISVWLMLRLASGVKILSAIHEAMIYLPYLQTASDMEYLFVYSFKHHFPFSFGYCHVLKTWPKLWVQILVLILVIKRLVWWWWWGRKVNIIIIIVYNCLSFTLFVGVTCARSIFTKERNSTRGKKMWLMKIIWD